MRDCPDPAGSDVYVDTGPTKRQHARSALLTIITAVVTIVFLVLLATRVAPWLRGPKAWRWPYAIPGTLRRLWLPAALLAFYAILSVWLVRRVVDRDPRAPTTWAVVLAVAASMLMTPGIQFALLYMDHADVRSQLFYRTVSEGANGFFNVGSVVMDRYDFMRYFSERALEWYPTHAERHPPGLPVLFSLARQWFDTTPRLTARLNDLYRSYQCHNVPLMNLPDGAIASASIQMAVPLMLSLVVPALYLLGREAYDRATGVRAVLLWPLLPGIALWSAYWTPLYALFTVLAILLAHYGLSRHRLVFFLASGAVISVSLFLSFGNAAIVGFIGLYALAWLVNARWGSSRLPRQALNWRWLLGGALLFILGTGSLWIWLWFRYRLNFFAVWQMAIGKHFEMNRVGWFWILYHLYDFYVAAVGIPILFYWAARTWNATRNAFVPRPQDAARRALDVLALSFLVGLVLLDLSGVARGEVARVWAFLVPLPLLIAVYRLPGHRFAFLALIVLVSLQLFVANVFVRYIGTDLSDPPDPPAQAVVDESWTPWQATWVDGIALRGVQVPDEIDADQPITIGAIWTTSQRIHRPYTAFVHMFDEQDKLVAQRDMMHLDNRWPTTCWRPGESFADRYTLVKLGPIEPGTHRIEIGHYWLPTGERLSVTGQGAQPHHTVAVGTIEVKDTE